jgi:predicted ATPase
MQLAKLSIENFRRIEKLDLDFTDALGRVREVTLLAAPNGAGKTTILDAIAAAIGPSTELPAVRQGFELSPRAIVRKGATVARVTCELRFSSEEVDLAREVDALMREVFPGEPRMPIPDVRQVELRWTYPASERGGSLSSATDGWTVLKTRVWIARLLQVRRAEEDWFRRAGQVVTIDQWRTTLSRAIRKDIAEIIAGHLAEPLMEPDDAREAARRTDDPKTILLDLAVRASFPSRGGDRTDDAFKRVREAYARVCAPREMLGAVRDEDGQLDLSFRDGENEYGYGGVSSGEAMILLFLTKLVSERIHRSLVLVDEIELHQHPVWQSRLLHMLPRIGEHNQIIATTHSDYLRDLVPHGALKDAAHGDVGVTDVGGPLKGAGEAPHA